MTEVATTLRTAYLAGPMRGYEEYNFPAFRKAAKHLRKKGWRIWSPAERDEDDPSIDHTENVAGWSGTRGLDYFMQFDLAAVCRNDCVICLPGWEASQGARLETMVATEVGHPVFELVKKKLHAVNPDYVRVTFAEKSLGVLTWEEDKNVEEPSELNWVATEEPATEDEIFAAAPSDEELLSAVDFPDFPEGKVEEPYLVPGPEGVDTPVYVSNDPTEISLRQTYEDWVAQNRALDGLSKLAEAVSAFEPPQSMYAESAVPFGSAERKAVPITSGVLDYFPAALVEVAKVSKAGNDKHNPGQPLHHARGKSTDHADSLLRHLIDRGKIDAETGQRHSAEVAWRALALLQQELEDEGAPLARGARYDIEPVTVELPYDAGEGL